MEDYYEYLDSNGVTTLYKLIKDDTVALIDSYSITINGITTNLDSHVNNTDIHTPIATIEGMIDTKVSGLVNSAPETLDTLKELSDALGNDPNFATTVANQIGNKASKDDVYTKEETDTLLEGKADSVHNHVVKDITDFPTIPTKTSELSNDSNFVTSTELHDYATKNDLNFKQDALSEEQLSNIDSIPDKANKSDLSTVATSGSYKDLLDKPVLPEGADLSDYYNKGETDNLLNSKANTSDLAVVAKSGNYNDLNNTPTIPTKVSQLENDTGFINALADVVDTKSNQTINGVKTFTESIRRKNGSVDLTVTPTGDIYSHYLFMDKNDKISAYIENAQRSNGVNDLGLCVHDKNGGLHGVQITSNNEVLHLGNYAYSLGSIDRKWANVYATTFNGNLKGNADTATSANDPNAVHKTGNETIKGVKYFDSLVYLHDNMSNKNSQMDLFTTPANTLYSHYMFVDKNNEVAAYMQYGQQNTGTDFIGLFIHDKNRALHGIQVTTNNEVIPISNNTYSLGSSTNKWSKVYSDDVVHTSGDETIGGNKTFTNQVYLGAGGTIMGVLHFISGGRMTSNNDATWKSLDLWSGSTNTNGATLHLRTIDSFSQAGTFVLSAKKADGTHADMFGSPDGTLTWAGQNIATTAWVMSYVNSVGGSGSVGASISAYYSNATTLTAESSSTIGTNLFPAVYSGYINIAPTVGTIYTGSQLFSSFTPTASGTKSSHVYQTYAKATATFSGAFSSSAKYLCTTANAVKFRAYVSQGTSSTMGTPSVVDNSSAKSIFIRVQ